MDPTVSQSKEELARKWLGEFDRLGSYRLAELSTVQEAGSTNFIEVEGLIGMDNDDDNRLVQLPITLRSAGIDPVDALSVIEHPRLGTRYVCNALADPIGVHEYIRIILEGDSGAPLANGVDPALVIHGSGVSGHTPTIASVTIQENTRQRSSGGVLIDGKERGFLLRIPRLLLPEGHPSRGHTVSPMRIMGYGPENPERQLVVAELTWTDVER